MASRCFHTAVLLVCVALSGSTAWAQSDAILATATSGAMTEWVTEKNRLLEGTGVKVAVSSGARELIVTNYMNHTTRFLARGDQAYMELAEYTVGRQIQEFLDKNKFYEGLGTNKRLYTVSVLAVPQVRRNITAILDQYLILQQVRKPNEKGIELTEGLIKEYAKIFDDCTLPPKTRLWCKH